ncbi:MAG: ABC transporter permease [Polyangiaceae bacterium]
MIASFGNTLSMAWQALRRHRMRSLLTMLGVVIGVGSVIALVTLGESATHQVTSEVAELGENLLWVSAGGRTPRGSTLPAPPLTLGDADAIAAQIPGVIRVAPASENMKRVVQGGASWVTAVAGVTDSYFEVRRYAVARGRRFSEAELSAGRSVCLIGPAVEKELYGGSDPLGTSLRIERTSCEVIGVLAKKNTSNVGENEDDVILMPLTAYHRRIAGNREVEVIFLSAAPGRSTALVGHQVRMLMRERRRIGDGQADDFRVRDLRAAAARITKITGVLTALLSAIAAVSLVVGGIGIMNIMLVSVTERTREIGIRLAIGARARDVLWQFLVEAVLLSTAGGVIGVTLGLAGSWAATHALKLGFVLLPQVIAVAFLFSALVGVAFGFMPARRAARLHPIEALRHE